ncbi:MAG TPA: hypothetical protein PKO26_06570 [Candidatus Cloacimonas sp.]|nr:hypothetical protein [Candidatus Cloacimonas sp.]HNS85141.1 hypothetical protein [Candidatus Cloacimonas sp.]
MGAQQILLLILSIIIIGTTIIVGITLYKDQAYTANKTALVAEAKNYGNKVIRYYKDLASQNNDNLSVASVDTTMLKKYLGWEDNYLNTKAGTFNLTSVSDSSVIITGYAKARKKGKNPKVVVTVTFPEGKMDVGESDAALR